MFPVYNKRLQARKKFNTVSNITSQLKISKYNGSEVLRTIFVTL